MISPPSFTELYYFSIAEKRGYHKKRFGPPERILYCFTGGFYSIIQLLLYGESDFSKERTRYGTEQQQQR